MNSTTIEYAKPQGTYYSILSDGKFHTQVDEGTAGAVRREYETSDGKKGVKYELIAQSISGRITNIAIYEGDYGKNLQVFMGDDVIVSLNCASNFGEDFMKKLPNIDIEKDVKLSPYSFEDADTKKVKKGITVYQDEKKIADFYHNKEGEKWVEANGYPKIPAKAKDWSKDEWKLFFLNARIFLLSEVEKSKLYNAVKPSDGKLPEYPVNDVDPLDVAF